MTALHSAAADGKVEILKLLLKKTLANVNKTDLSGWTAAHCAVESIHTSAAGRGFCEPDDDSPAKKTAIGILRALVAHGADLEMTEINEMTPFDQAVSRNEWQVASELLSLGASLGRSCTPYFGHVIEASLHGDMTLFAGLLRHLQDRGLDIYNLESHESEQSAAGTAVNLAITYLTGGHLFQRCCAPLCATGSVSRLLSGMRPGPCDHDVPYIIWDYERWKHDTWGTSPLEQCLLGMHRSLQLKSDRVKEEYWLRHSQSQHSDPGSDLTRPHREDRAHHAGFESATGSHQWRSDDQPNMTPKQFFLNSEALLVTLLKAGADPYLLNRRNRALPGGILLDQAKHLPGSKTHAVRALRLILQHVQPALRPQYVEGSSD